MAAPIDWVPVLNTTTQIIPPGGLMSVVADPDPITGAIQVGQPALNGDVTVLVNSLVAIPAATSGNPAGSPSPTGQGTFDPRAVIAYDPADGTPVVGQQWGSKAGSWLAGINGVPVRTGFSIVGGAGMGLVNASRWGLPAPQAAGCSQFADFSGDCLFIPEVDVILTSTDSITWNSTSDATINGQTWSVAWAQVGCCYRLTLVNTGPPSAGGGTTVQLYSQGCTTAASMTFSSNKPALTGISNPSCGMASPIILTVECCQESPITIPCDGTTVPKILCATATRLSDGAVQKFTLVFVGLGGGTAVWNSLEMTDDGITGFPFPVIQFRVCGTGGECPPGDATTPQAELAGAIFGEVILTACFTGSPTTGWAGGDFGGLFTVSIALAPC